MGRQGAPILGDDVYVGTGATLVGKIRVGNGAKIAANTLVMSNIPEGATVMGVPGRIIMRAPKAVQPLSMAAAASRMLYPGRMLSPRSNTRGTFLPLPASRRTSCFARLHSRVLQMP